jgi:chemotaxis protein MotB
MSSHGGRRKKHGGEHENSERWLLTYADMITLLVAFFIMLYAMSVTNTAKFVKLAISVRSGFGNVTGNKPSILNGMGGGSPLPAVSPITPVVKPSDPKDNQDGGTVSRREVEKEHEISDALKKAIEHAALADHVAIHEEERGVVVSVVADKYTFDSGSAALKPALMPILDKIGGVIKQVPNNVRVEGHTDNLPIDTPQFPSNWQLSAIRASNVLCYFVSTGNAVPDRIDCVGYGSTKPIVPNTTEYNRAKNRRVEIVFLRGDLHPTASPLI